MMEEISSVSATIVYNKETRYTRKNKKNLDTRKKCCNYRKIWTIQKTRNGKQSEAVWSESTVFAPTYQSE